MTRAGMILHALSACLLLAAAIPAWGKEIKAGHVCTFTHADEVDQSFALLDPTASSEKAVEEVLRHCGLTNRTFTVHAANVPNAAAVIDGTTRYVLYNPNFMEQLFLMTGTKWAFFSVMAHEIGHHVNGHTLENDGSRPAIELEADEFSGFVMFQMGATLAESQIAMAKIASEEDGDTHPGRRKRLVAIANGWTKAKELRNTSPVASTCTHMKPCVHIEHAEGDLEHETDGEHEFDVVRSAAGPKRVECVHRVPCTHKIGCKHAQHKDDGVEHPEGH